MPPPAPTPASERARVKLAWRQMPVLTALRRRFRPEKPLRDVRIAAALHISAESAHLLVSLKDAGAQLLLFPSDPRTVDPGAVAELERLRAVRVLPGEPGALPEELDRFRPQLLIDNSTLLGVCRRSPRAAGELAGATVHSRSGLRTVRELLAEEPDRPPVPVIAMADNPLKSAIETPMGTGQSTAAALIRATGMQLGGKRVVVIGYGTAGAGIAAYLSALRARVTVVDVSAVACLRAVAAGYGIDSLTGALSYADAVIVASGTHDVITGPDLDLLQDGAVLGNIGHYPDAIDVPALRAAAKKVLPVAPGLEEYQLPGKSLYLLGGGAQFNHVCGDGNAGEMMDLSLSLHALCTVRLWERRGQLPPGLGEMPGELTDAVARAKLRSLGYVA
ncbi:adenosylhomocysteinase [Streptomyces caatingaensis]|uniref:adenosylhomocysteinase n=1 Tax=Streptomyces caatingaensis TaxID=1678637 RepID=UPI0012FE97ED|nr:adenosylhomocysteinase [Streptomyces caatingaensis]